MFLKTLRNLRHTLALRLTIWYGIFVGSSILAFALVDALIISLMQAQLDEDLQEDLEEFAALLPLPGLNCTKSEIRLETQGDAASDAFFRLWTPDGGQLMTSDLSSWLGLSDLGAGLGQVAGATEPILETLSFPEREYFVRIIYGIIGPDIVLQIGESLEDEEDFSEVLLTGFVMVMAAVILLGGPIGWFMARRALRGVEAVACTATEIADGALDQRVITGFQGDELDRLARAFNAMLDRIQALILGMREMADNLAHDLRSPVARIRASAEMALTSDGSKTEWETLASDTTEECDRLLEMINTTLDIAEAESGAAKPRITDVDLVEIVVDACDLFQTVAEDKNIAVVTDLPAYCRVQGDLQRLQRVLANLLDNALKYTPSGGRVIFKLVDEGQRVKLLISDTGVGISAEELP